MNWIYTNMMVFNARQPIIRNVNKSFCISFVLIHIIIHECGGCDSRVKTLAKIEKRKFVQAQRIDLQKRY